MIHRAEICTRADELLTADRRVGVLASRHPDDPPELLPDQLVILDPPRDVEEYARVLYARLREADELGLEVLLVVPPAETDGLGAAVADRVRRAAG
jgi:L-threonylcarbamoyladenylate synthase